VLILFFVFAVCGTLIPLQTSFHFISSHVDLIFIQHVLVLSTVSLCVCHNVKDGSRVDWFK